MSTLLLISGLLFSLLTSNIPQDNNQLPKTWSEEFKIELSFTGSMDGSNTHIIFTFDSCKYVSNRGMNPQTKKYYLMTGKDRTEVLNKLRMLKIEKVKSEPNIAPVNDGWSQLLCYGSHCIQGGTSASMSEDDKNTFSDTYTYLESFASSKAKRKLR